MILSYFYTVLVQKFAQTALFDSKIAKNSDEMKVRSQEKYLNKFSDWTYEGGEKAQCFEIQHFEIFLEFERLFATKVADFSKDF